MSLGGVPCDHHLSTGSTLEGKVMNVDQLKALAEKWERKAELLKANDLTFYSVQRFVLEDCAEELRAALAEPELVAKYIIWYKTPSGSGFPSKELPLKYEREDDARRTLLEWFQRWPSRSDAYEVRKVMVPR
jgi:hypothetical protein